MGPSHAYLRTLTLPVWMIYVVAQGCLPAGDLGPMPLTGDAEAPGVTAGTTVAPVLTPVVEARIARAEVTLPAPEDDALPTIQLDASPAMALTVPARQVLRISLDGQVNWKEGGRDTVEVSITIDAKIDNAWVTLGEQAVRGRRQGPTTAGARAIVPIVFESPAARTLRVTAHIAVWSPGQSYEEEPVIQRTAETLITLEVTPSTIMRSTEPTLPPSPVGPQWLEPVP